MNKNIGRLNSSILATMPVNIMATEPKAIPPRNAANTIKSPSRITDQSEETYYNQHDNCSNCRFCRSPDYFTGDNFFGVEWSGHHGVKRFLVIHPHKGTEGIFVKKTLFIIFIATSEGAMKRT